MEARGLLIVPVTHFVLVQVFVVLTTVRSVVAEVIKAIPLGGMRMRVGPPVV